MSRPRGIQGERPRGAPRGPDGVQREAPRQARRPARIRRQGGFLRRLAWALGGAAGLATATGIALRLAVACDFPDPPVACVLFGAFAGAALLICQLFDP